MLFLVVLYFQVLNSSLWSIWDGFYEWYIDKGPISSFAGIFKQDFEPSMNTVVTIGVGAIIGR